jgi:hypothetical protein
VDPHPGTAAAVPEIHPKQEPVGFTQDEVFQYVAGTM